MWFRQAIPQREAARFDTVSAEMLTAPVPEVAPRLRRMAFYQGVFRANFDGTMTTMSRVVEGLAARGVEQLVLTPLPPAPEEESPTRVVPVRSLPFPFYPRYRVALPPRRKVWRLLDEFEPDLVQIGTPDLGGWCVLDWARARGVPAVGGYHTHFPSYLRYYRLGFMEGCIWRRFRSFYNACARTLVPARAIMRELEEHGIERLVLWDRGVDVESFSPRRRDPELRRQFGAEEEDVLFAYAGRFVAEKNVEPVARAFAMVRERCPRARFVFIGDGPREAAVRRILPGAAFPGYLTGRELHRACAAADVFCFASDTEAFGNVVLEAMASGLAVVTLAGTAMGDRVGEAGAGLTVPRAEPELLAAALERLYGDPENRRRCAENAVAYARRKNWTIVLEEHFRVYEEVLAERAGEPVRAGVS